MTSKRRKGSVSLKLSNDRIQLVWRFGGKRYYLSTGYPDEARFRKLAEMKASEIEKDILMERFDLTLEKYKGEREATDRPKVKFEHDLQSLWLQFLDFKRPQCAPSTMANQYQAYTSYVERSPTHDLNKASEIRDYAIAEIPLNSAKRFLTIISSCCDWAVASRAVDRNPFAGMGASIKLPKGESEDDDIDPFTASERDQIIEAFRVSRYYKIYAPLIQFLFNTGCRPSEALALQWNHVAKDLKSLTFVQALTKVERGGYRIKQGLKTQDRRRFPCNEYLRSLLMEIRPDFASNQLVFPSPNSKTIDWHNFGKRGWASILETVGLEYRKPYQMRHTFITLALLNKMDVKDVARLVGNSPEVIYKHYAAGNRELEVPLF